MNKIYNSFFDETYYLEKLNNGLEVIIFHKPNFLSTSAAFGTAYGALNINQKLAEKEFHFNPGIAHFLEHKLFECEEKDIFTQFSNLGCNVNAFTSYHETVYYFQTAGKNIAEPLNLLIDFVLNLNISEKSVEKEKGIIIQELAMYMQNADSRLLDETYKSLYAQYPLKYDVGGDKDSVNKITKEELELCYKLNYHPSNMAIVIVSPIDPEEIIKVIKENKKLNSYTLQAPILSCDEKEPIEVVRENYSFKMDIKNPKHCLAYKLRPDFRDKKDCAFKEWCVNIFLKAYFSPINPNYQKWLNEGLINDYFGYEVDFDLNYAYILFYCESNEDILEKLIVSELEKDLLTQDILAQVKRRYIGMLFDTFNDVDNLDTGYIRDYLNGVDYFENIQILMDIQLKDVIDSFRALDLSKKAFIHIYPVESGN